MRGGKRKKNNKVRIHFARFCCRACRFDVRRKVDFVATVGVNSLT